MARIARKLSVIVDCVKGEWSEVQISAHFPRSGGEAFVMISDAANPNRNTLRVVNPDSLDMHGDHPSIASGEWVDTITVRTMIGDSGEWEEFVAAVSAFGFTLDCES